ncbi:hypothetical protein [Desertivirga xinjiangensis]|uniref:hypothetical protein n=1 Tax=Desertivirga xinjiangensis TaxID=539206 RepID=UPI00210BBCA8|nr:hypothetical protein [Pedobacter xinjiangensis]
MEQKETFVNRENKGQPFDKRLIKEIVKLVEEGLPRREAVARYGMSKGTLSEWMKIYGSDQYRTNKRRTYKPAEKRSVLRAIESGMTAREVQIAFGITNAHMVRAWVREAKQENADLSLTKSTTPLMAEPSKKSDNDQVQALQQALAEAELKIKALDTLIDIAEEQLKINIRKKSGARQSQK